MRPDNFVSEFERAYRDEMTRGEALAEEEAAPAVRGEEYQELFAQYRDRFIQDTEMSVADWVRCERRLFFVTNQVDLEFFGAYVGDYLDLNRAQIDWLNAAAEQGELRAAFGQLNTSLPPDRQARLLSSVQHLVVADVYCAPSLEVMEAMAA